MRVFLTGGTGFIGQRLTRVMRDRGWEVTALVRRPDSQPASAIQDMGAQLVRGDILDPESMRGAMQGADAVIHNAGWYDVGVRKKEFEKVRATNATGVAITIGLAVELGIPRIVHVSTIAVFGDTGGAVADETFQRINPPRTIYEETKTEGHAIAVRAQEQGAPVIIVCPAGVIGPGDHTETGHFARMYVRGILMPIFVFEHGSRGVVHVDDLAEAVALVVETGKVGETYILSGGNIGYRDQSRVWAQTPGGMKPRIAIPDSVLRMMCIVSEPILRVLGLPIVFSRGLYASGTGQYLVSAEKAERELGARFREPEQAWLDTLAAERAIAKGQ